MRLICIDDCMLYPNNKHASNLTIGKIYDVIEGQSIKNDLGIPQFFNPKRFISLEEYRNTKIEEILK